MKKITRRNFLQASGVAALALATAACSSETESSTATSTATSTAASSEATLSEEPVELKVFGFKTATELEPYTELFAQFEAEYSNITINYEGITNAGGYQDVLTTRLAAGSDDDVMLCSSSFIPLLQQAGYLVDLSYMEILDNYQYDMTVGGIVPGLALSVSLFGMFVNHDILDAAGVAGVPTTYDEFMDACEKILAAGYNPIVASSGDGTGAAILACTRGLESVYLADDVDAQVAALDSGEQALGDTMRVGFEWAAELNELGYVDGERALVMADMGEGVTEYVKGQSAFMLHGNWGLNDTVAGLPDANITLEGVPASNDGPILLSDAGVRIAINVDSPYQAEAELLINFMLRTENSDYLVQYENAYTPLKDGTSNSNEMVAGAADVLKSGRSFPWANPQFSNIDTWALAKEYGSNIFAGADVDTVVADVNADVEMTILLG